jgi:excisionase family DNA binding protein
LGGISSESKGEGEAIDKKQRTYLLGGDISPPLRGADRLLTKQQVAAWLGIRVSTLNTWIAQRRIPYIKLAKGNLVRFKPSQIEQWLGESEVEPM